MAEHLIIDRNDLKWHHFDDPEDPELVVLAAHYSLHELALEDCISQSSRAKMDDYGSYLFFVLNALTYNAERETIVEDLICVFVGESFIITIADHKNKIVSRTIAKQDSGRVYKSSQEILYMLTDTVCDQFFPAIDDVSDEISKMELLVYERHEQSIPLKAVTLKKILIFLRRNAVQHRELINHLLRRHPQFIDTQMHLYFRDVYDHLVQAVELIETNRDLLVSIVEINLSSTAQRTNEIVKTLTIYATIMLPLNVVTGYFGMNFVNLPLINTWWGLPLVSSILLLMTAATTIYFRTRKL